MNTAIGIAAIAAGVLQAGALIFYAGVLTQTTRDLQRRVSILEKVKDETLRVIGTKLYN